MIYHTNDISYDQKNKTYGTAQAEWHAQDE